MPNIVETVFSSRDTGVVETVEKINNKLPEIARTAAAAGAGIDTLELKLRRLAAIASNHNVEISKADYAALRSKGIPAIDAAIEKIQKATDAQRAQTRETERTAEANRKVEQAVARIRAQEARTAQIASQSSPTTRVGQFGAPDAAAASALERTTQGFGKATEGAQKLQRGAAELRQTLFSLSGVPYPEAANQLSKLLGGSLTGTLAIAGIAAIGAVAVSVSQQVREQAETDLKKIQSLANQGLTGGLERRNTELERLQQIAQAAREARVVGGNPAALISSQLAQEVPENEIKKSAREIARVFTAAIASEDIAKGFFGDPQKLIVGIKSQYELELRINAILQQRKTIEDALGITRKKQLDLARESRKVEENLVDHINSVFGAYQKESQEAEKARKATEEQQRHAQAQAEISVASLRAQLSDNPYEKFYLQASTAVEQFREQNRQASEETLDQGEKLIKQLERINVLRERLSRAGQLSETIADIDRLSALGGRSRQQQIGQERTGFLNAQFDNQLEVARLLGRNISDSEAVWRRVQTIQETLTGRTAAEAIEAATRGLTPQQLDQAGLRNARIGALEDVGRFQREDFQRQQRIRQIEDQSRERQIAAAETALRSAQSPEQRRLAIEAGLSATKDIGNLTVPQIESRARLLEQSLSIQLDVERARQARELNLLNAQKENTLALVQVGNRLAAVEGALGNFKEGALTIRIDNESTAAVDTGTVAGTTPFRAGNSLSNNF